MQVWIYKGERMLYLRSEGRTLLACPVALGRCPLGHKQREGDGRTPEGSYFLHGTGGEDSPYAEEKLIRLSKKKAEAWEKEA